MTRFSYFFSRLVLSIPHHFLCLHGMLGSVVVFGLSFSSLDNEEGGYLLWEGEGHDTAGQSATLSYADPDESAKFTPVF